MPTYAIGDIQGCFDDLQRLLERLDFDPGRDRLWLVGDLVNRGPKSLETLRFIKALGERAVAVLGNHDLHLLATWRKCKGQKRGDTIAEVLAAPDADEILHWLRRRPLLHHDATLGYSMVHAGLPPQWDLATARQLAAEVEAVLRGDDFVDFLERMYGNEPDRWSTKLTGWERLRFAVNCFTRLRYVTADGHLEFNYKGKPGTQDSNLVPWFQAEDRRSRGERLVFGHWSTLGLFADGSVFALDSGCLWGGSLSALCLESGTVEGVACAGVAREKGNGKDKKGG